VTAHPVIEVLRARREAGSAPRARADGARVALVLEGGGMRGVVSAAMAGALERAGLRDAFDLVVGTSAGALNGAALLAGVAEGCAVSYVTAFAGERRFVNLRRLLVGRPAVDVAWTLDHSSELLDAERHGRTLASPIELHCIAVDVDAARPEDLCGMRTAEELRGALLASSRLPLVGGDPVRLGGRRYLDGGLAEPVPLAPALAAGATHALVLQTRPLGVPRASPGGVADRLIERRLRALNPALVALYRRRTDDYERITEDIAARSARPATGPPHVLGIRPPADAPVVHQLEADRDVLQAASEAARAAMSALGTMGPWEPSR
jgi:predicted patatin/cPLA2 family phospholipase